MELFDLIEKNEISLFIEKFSSNEYSETDFTQLLDNNNDTLLTKSVNLNITKISIFLITQLKYYLEKDNEKYLNFLNKKNDKGYNALLYSAFRGNWEVLDKLLNNRASIDTMNNNGLNLLHLASQGNHPDILVFLIEKYNFDINSLDSNGNSALHWAVYMNSYQIIDYLIYYGIDVNIQERDGYTPLHFAIINKNYRMVKKLINLKCDCDIETSNGKNAIKLCEEYELGNIKYLLLKSKFHINLAFIPFVICFTFIEAINQYVFINIFRVFKCSFFFLIFYFVLLLFLHKVMLSDSGEIENKLDKTLIQLCEDRENLKSICPWCFIYSNPYTKHCYICNKCINYKEFHNNWINNCIGRRNIYLYFQFLGFLVIYIFIKVIFSFICLLAISSNRNFFVIFHIIINLSFIGLIIYYVYRTYCNFKSRNFSHYYEETDNEVNISPKTDAMKVDESEKNDLSILPLQLNK